MSASKRSSRTFWNYTPEIPVAITPIFDWPPTPIKAIRWLASYWLAVSMVVTEMILAVVIYQFFQPSTVEMSQFAVGWIAQIWIRNVILMLLIAGGLHLYLHTFRKQGLTLKYEKRQLNRKGRAFTFNNQVYDNMFWTLASGVTFWTIYECLYFWAASNAYIPHNSFMGNPIWFVLAFILVPIWSSFHFYWVHRLLHWPPLYKLAHALHHRNVNVGPWSGISMHPVEHVIYFSSLAIHFVVATHPLHFLFHAYFQALGPVASHSGFEGLQIRGKNRMKLGEFFHTLHHRHFICNFGTVEMPWDRWFGSYYDGTPKSYDNMKRRRKPAYSDQVETV